MEVIETSLPPHLFTVGYVVSGEYGKAVKDVVQQIIM